MRTFLEEVRIRFLGDEARIARMSLIDESGERYVRMAHLACVGSHAINGVAELHSELLKRDVLKDFYEMWPQKFSNKTNGVTPRRWMVLSNPKLSDLITEHIGDGLDQGSVAAQVAWSRWRTNAEFRARWREIKQHNKQDGFAALALQRTGIVDRSRFDFRHPGEAHSRVQAPASCRCCTSCRSITGIKSNPALDVQPRTFIFRRQGGARISSREAHDQIDHRRRRRRQSGSRRAIG
jgi:starch phosphorylase